MTTGLWLLWKGTQVICESEFSKPFQPPTWACPGFLVLAATWYLKPSMCHISPLTGFLWRFYTSNPDFCTSEMEEVTLYLTIYPSPLMRSLSFFTFPCSELTDTAENIHQMVFNWDDPHYLWMEREWIHVTNIQPLCNDFRGRVWGRTKCMGQEEQTWGQKTLVPRIWSQKQIASLLVSRWWRWEKGTQ